MRRLGRLVRLILLTSKISAGEIKNTCKNETSWAYCPSHLLTSIISAKENRKCKMRRLGRLVRLVRLILLISILSAEENLKKM